MNYENIKKLCKNARLVAVSKYVDESAILSLFEKGQIEFGENKVQDLCAKSNSLPKEIKWHFLGNLQKNKINHLVRAKPCMWQSCASFEMALEVDKRLDCELETLLEINSANEPSKGGCKLQDAINIYHKIQKECKNIKLVGVMSIGANSDDLAIVKESFLKTIEIYEKLQENGAKYCSMGMSGDFKLALECGSNMVRLGSILFKGQK